ncbi:hypothetical protein ACFZCP_35160 [Streptomyces sp. NPDC007971]
MIKEPPGVTFCKRCGLPISLGAATARGEGALPRHTTAPGRPTECPKQK